MVEIEQLSVAPDGSIHPIPSLAQLHREFEQIRLRAQAYSERSGTVVVVQGLGFVGSAVAAVVSAARDDAGSPRHFVIGVDLATPAAFWKVAKMNAGQVAFASPDPELSALIHEGANVARNLVATAVADSYALADVIVVDLPFDAADRFELSASDIAVRLQPFEAGLRTVAEKMKPDALVLVETTVPVGTCERIVRPLMESVRKSRGIDVPMRLAHAYERVMPGPRYVDSIRRFWRTFAGIDAASASSAREFLSSFIDTSAYPLCELHDTKASELAKVLENSYRAVNIAFIYEWTLFAEEIGVDLFEVVNSIRIRRGTHDNMRFPGFGVGGYCLTKDSLLAQWSATELLDTGVVLQMTLDALRINQEMPLHTRDLLLQLTGGTLAEVPVTIAGVSYIAEVGDTRNSPTEILADALEEMGVALTVSDPCLGRWEERPNVLFLSDFAESVRGARAIVFTVPHRSYTELAADDLLKAAPSLQYVVDAFNVIGDETAEHLRSRGVRVAGVGKGHWRKRGYNR